MIKLIKNLILLFILIVGSFLYVAIEYGGEGFRVIGDTVKSGTIEISDTADMIKESAEGIRRTATETVTAIKKTSKKIKETSSKVASTVEKTSSAISHTAQSISQTADNSTDDSVDDSADNAIVSFREDDNSMEKAIKVND